MAEETKYDKQAKLLRYRFDRESVKKMGWEKIDRKEKDYWRGRVQQWNQDRVTPNMQYNPRPHRSSSHN
jgi:hypothetical protein